MESSKLLSGFNISFILERNILVGLVRNFEFSPPCSKLLAPLVSCRLKIISVIKLTRHYGMSIGLKCKNK